MARDRDSPPGRPVASVARALALLDELGAATDGLGVNELARRIGVNASTASRLLATLEAGGMVERATGGGPYRLGLRLVALADGVLARLDARELARPRLRELVAATGETATLSVPGSFEAVTVDFVAAESSVVSVARLGRPSVGHATAAGKVVLAFGPAAPRTELTRFTERTIVDPDALAAEIDGVRTRGWAEAAGEREPDLNALAAPVFGRSGELAAVLGLQGPAARLTSARRAEVLPAVLEAAGALSAALGGARAG
jgi:IclR family acetate operon transcriptional repressor